MLLIDGMSWVPFAVNKNSSNSEILVTYNGLLHKEKFSLKLTVIHILNDNNKKTLRTVL